MKNPRSHPNPLLAGLRLPPGIQKSGLIYAFLRMMTHVLFAMMWKVRTFDRHLEPAAGGVVYVCNHQSFLDPMLMATMLKRPVNFLARDTLFRWRPFAALISSVNAFPVKRGRADTGAIKESMRRLRAGGQVVVFAEGTRTRDGRIGPLLPGVVLLAQRAAEWTIPVVIDGAFECWPRWRPLPGAGSITVRYGQPIPQSEAAAMTPQELLQRVRSAMIDLQTDLRRRARRPPLKYETI